MRQNLETLHSALRRPSKVVIVTHKNPDGDALGSSLALAAILKKLLHQVTVVLPNEYPPLFHFLPGIDQVVIGEMKPEEASGHFEKADIIFCLDFNTLERIDKFGLDVLASTARKVLIDHHLDPEPIADHMYSNTSASSTAELIYEFLHEMGLDGYIDVPIAEALYTGILTDTGSFKYSTNANVFEVAAALKRKGMDDYTLQNRLFNSLTEKQLKLIGHCLNNRLEVLSEYQTGIIWLDKEDYRQWGIGRGDTEGIVNYMLLVRNIRMAIFVTEQQNVTKLSFRSKGIINVQEICSTHFNGGGHKNASGGQLKLPLAETLAKIREIVPQVMSTYLQHHEL